MEESCLTQDTIAKKELNLARAMDLTEELSHLESKKEAIRNEIKALQDQVSCLDAKISAMRSSADFKTPERISDLSAEIAQLKRSASAPPHPFDPDFEDAPTLCSTCARVVSRLAAFPCHNCGFFVCERCLEKARQCPKCLMADIDNYTCCDGALTHREGAGGGTADGAQLLGVGAAAADAGAEPLYHVLEGELESDAMSAAEDRHEENIYQALEDFEKPVSKCEALEDEKAASNANSGSERQRKEDGDWETATSEEPYAAVAKPMLRRTGALDGSDIDEGDSDLEHTTEDFQQVANDPKPPIEEEDGMSRIARLRSHFEPKQ